jgi:hypothetical protein
VMPTKLMPATNDVLVLLPVTASARSIIASSILAGGGGGGGGVVE